MSMNQIDDLTDYQSLSLAGIVLAAELVHARARGIGPDPAATRAVKKAITSQHAQSLREVFPDTVDFRSGAEATIEALEGKPSQPDVLRYALQLIELATLLKRSPQVVELLGRELDALPTDPTDAEFARVYQSSISTLGKRIEVTGNPELLKQEATADEIRTLLLGGVRFAWLWQQLGGRRWHLILQRKAILRAMKALNTILTSTIH
jgi:high frequency lysogenization protein